MRQPYAGISHMAKREKMAALPKIYLLFEAAKTIKMDSMADCLLRKLSEGAALSGWDLVKIMDSKPDVIREKIEMLRGYGVIALDGEGLSGFYYVTAAGYKVQELLLRS